jgi:hypothetical protein
MYTLYSLNIRTKLDGKKYSNLPTPKSVKMENLLHYTDIIWVSGKGTQDRRKLIPTDWINELRI